MLYSRSPSILTPGAEVERTGPVVAMFVAGIISMPKLRNGKAELCARSRSWDRGVAVLGPS
jgi:hypothetical protein